MNKITVICLGVRDMARSVRFYRDGLGFSTDETDDCPDVIFFDTAGIKLELYPLELLAQDIDPAAPPATANGFGGITLAYNAQTKEEVRELTELARRAGAAIVQEPCDVFWGGYHAYFADPDGYYWEIAWGPNFKYDDRGLLL